MSNVKNIIFILFLITLMGCATSTKVVVDDDYDVVKLYYPSGILKSVWISQDGKLNGIKREYTENGTLKVVTNYKNNIIDGMKNDYHPDGSLWRKEIYKEGILIARKEFDKEGLLKSEEKFN